MMDRFTKGHCLITMATGEISQAEADRAGLVPTHAYAMLDIRIVKVIHTHTVGHSCQSTNNVTILKMFFIKLILLSHFIDIGITIFSHRLALVLPGTHVF